jgi:hypothetical protein
MEDMIDYLLLGLGLLIGFGLLFVIPNEMHEFFERRHRRNLEYYEKLIQLEKAKSVCQPAVSGEIAARDRTSDSPQTGN